MHININRLASRLSLRRSPMYFDVKIYILFLHYSLLPWGPEEEEQSTLASHISAVLVFACHGARRCTSSRWTDNFFFVIEDYSTMDSIPALSSQRNLLKEICAIGKRQDEYKQWRLDTKQKKEKADKEIEKIISKREECKENTDRSSSSESDEEQFYPNVGETDSTSHIQGCNIDDPAGNATVHANVEEDEANTESDTDTEVETDDEETEIIDEQVSQEEFHEAVHSSGVASSEADAEAESKDPHEDTQGVKLRADVDNAETGREVLGLVIPATNPGLNPVQGSNVRDGATVLAAADMNAQTSTAKSCNEDVIDLETIFSYATEEQMSASYASHEPDMLTTEKTLPRNSSPQPSTTRYIAKRKNKKKRKRNSGSRSKKKKQKKTSVLSKRSGKKMIFISPSLHSYYTDMEQSEGCYVPINILGPAEEGKFKVELPHLSRIPLLGAPIRCSKEEFRDRDKRMRLPVPPGCKPAQISTPKRTGSLLRVKQYGSCIVLGSSLTQSGLTYTIAIKKFTLTPSRIMNNVSLQCTDWDGIPNTFKRMATKKDYNDFGIPQYYKSQEAANPLLMHAQACVHYTCDGKGKGEWSMKGRLGRRGMMREPTAGAQPINHIEFYGKDGFSGELQLVDGKKVRFVCHVHDLSVCKEHSRFQLENTIETNQFAKIERVKGVGYYEHNFGAQNIPFTFTGLRRERVDGSGMFNYDVFQHKQMQAAREDLKSKAMIARCHRNPKNTELLQLHVSCANCLKSTPRPLAAYEVECMHCGQRLIFASHNFECELN